MGTSAGLSQKSATGTGVFLLTFRVIKLTFRKHIILIINKLQAPHTYFTPSPEVSLTNKQYIFVIESFK